MSARPSSRAVSRARYQLVVGLLFIGAAVLGWRAVDLQANKREFLQSHGDARYLRVEQIAANRGMILDRNGDPLAVSTPTESAWVRPDHFVAARDNWPLVAATLGLTVDQIETLILPRLDKKFDVISRRMKAMPCAVSMSRACTCSKSRGATTRPAK